MKWLVFFISILILGCAEEVSISDSDLVGTWNVYEIEFGYRDYDGNFVHGDTLQLDGHISFDLSAAGTVQNVPYFYDSCEIDTSRLFKFTWDLRKISLFLTFEFDGSGSYDITYFKKQNMEIEIPFITNENGTYIRLIRMRRDE